MGKLLSFIKKYRPYSKYKNPNLTPYERFRKPEEKSMEWSKKVEDASKCKSLGGFLKFASLVAFTKFDYLRHDLDVLIFEFTSKKDVTDKQFDEYTRFVKKRNKKIKEIRRENRDYLKISVGDKKIRIASASSLCPKLLEVYPDLLSHERNGKCHARSINIAAHWDYSAECVTGVVHHRCKKEEYLHSWVEFTEDDGREFVIDVTENTIMRKEHYYWLNNARVMKRISRKQILEDRDFINDFCAKDEWNIKLYLTSPNEAHEIMESEEKS